ncbi:hypothetical protein [Paraburkholderia heleia]|uniref:hypothetical protein n=1 Tax=Paraburkholderia heleia TaxID=634127 RepID=UPI002AB62B17|nr:hypothetical protein [Paraburkholderia heleia]
MDYDYWRKLERAVAQSEDMTVAKGDSSAYTPPAEGIAQARLVGYFELGRHVEKNREEQDVEREKVDLIFELSGPNYPPRGGANGVKIPQRIAVRETLSLDANADFFKLFGAMNYAGKARHMAQLLGQSFLVEVFHKKSKDGKQARAVLKGPWGYNVKGPFYQDRHSGETVAVDVPPAITGFRYFIWNAADKQIWDSIYIEGEYEACTDKDGREIAPAKSKNVLQEQIMKATNWPELAARLGI